MNSIVTAPEVEPKSKLLRLLPLNVTAELSLATGSGPAPASSSAIAASYSARLDPAFWVSTRAREQAATTGTSRFMGSGDIDWGMGKES